MALVLAIEPDPKQASILRRVVRERARAEITVVDTKDAAIAALSGHPPDLILVTALMSPRDEEDLVAHLRTLGEEAGHLQTITIPLLSSAGVADEDEEGFFKRRFRRKKDTSNGVGCDPWTFAEQVAGYVRAATETRAARQAELDYAQRRAAHRESSTDTAAAQAAAAVPMAVDAEPATSMSDLVFTQITPPEVTPPRAPAEPVRQAAQETAKALPEPIAPVPQSVVLPEPAFVEPEPVEIPRPRGVPALDPAYFKTEPVRRAPEPAPPEPEPLIVPEPVVAEPEPLIVPEPVVAAEPEPVVLPEPMIAAEPEPVILPESEPVVAEPAYLEPEPLQALEPVLAIEPAPFEPEVLEPIALEAAFEPAIAKSVAAEPELVAAAAEPNVDTPQQSPDVPPEPVYQTSPERVFDSVVEEPPKKQSRWRKVLAREFGRKTQPDTPAPPPLPPVPVYKPLKRLPPLAMWARTEDLLLPEPEPVVTKPADDMSDLFDSLAVPPHILAVSYPRRPHVRRVRAG